MVGYNKHKFLTATVYIVSFLVLFVFALIVKMMETLKAFDCERLKQHQTMYKAKTPPWKDAFRERCIQRLRSNRSRLVDKFRGLALAVDGTIDVVMKEEWESFSVKQNDLPRIFGVDHKEVDDAEVNEYISILEEIQQELIEEEKRILEEYLAEVEAEQIHSTVDLLERNEVICPLCKKHALHQNLSVIFCGCGFRIDTQDGFTLDNFKQQLHEGLDTHEKSCSFEPSFSILQCCSCTNLAIMCEACNYMYLVV